jgi:hypothetical protein
MNAEIINYSISILGMSYAVYVMKTKSGNEKMFNIPVKYIKTAAFIGIGIFTSMLVLSIMKK